MNMLLIWCYYTQAKCPDVEGEKEPDSPPIYRTLNPLDFILMKEEYIRKNPPPPKKEFVKVFRVL